MSEAKLTGFDEMFYGLHTSALKNYLLQDGEK